METKNIYITLTTTAASASSCPTTENERVYGPRDERSPVEDHHLKMNLEDQREKCLGNPGMQKVRTMNA